MVKKWRENILHCKHGSAYRTVQPGFKDGQNKAIYQWQTRPEILELGLQSAKGNTSLLGNTTTQSRGSVDT